MMKTSRLVRIELTVSNLARAEAFYTSLDFKLEQYDTVDPAIAALLRADAIEQITMRRGGQIIALQCFTPAGAPYPADPTAADQSFQHFAMPTADIAAAYAKLSQPAISSGGPQHLPARSGGSTAYKFRDPDGHPLELIQFPDRAPGGIDHSAIVVADVERSIEFYRDQLGFTLAARQLNTGIEQDRLDGLDDVQVDVVALEPATKTPHLELLAYRSPQVRSAPPTRPCDVVATRLVLEVDGLTEPAALIEDPDGHELLLLRR